MRKWLQHTLTLGRTWLKVPLSERLSKVSDHLELAGIGCLVAAAFMWVAIVGMVALGIALIYLGWVTHVPSKA